MSDNIVAMEEIKTEDSKASKSAESLASPATPSSKDNTDYHVFEATYGPRKSVTSLTTDIRPNVEDEFQDRDNTIFNRRLMIAGGFLDIALFSSNCEQLKSIIEIGQLHNHYEFVFSLIITSLVLQVGAGFTMFLVGCHAVRNPSDRRRADIMNHITMGLVALITVVNIFISSFTVKGEFLRKCARGDLMKSN